ncbi:MAG TPA: P-loop NTPase fold protein [Terriglobia bacterium]
MSIPRRQELVDGRLAFTGVNGRFMRTQLQRAGVGLLAGSVAAIVGHLFARDRVFTGLLRSAWTALPAKLHFDGFQAYSLELALLCLSVAVLFLPPALRWLLPFTRAWWAGIVSLTPLTVALSIFVVVTWGPIHPKATVFAGVALVLGVVGAECWRRARPPASAELSIKLDIPVAKRSASSEHVWKPSTSDDPIGSWDQDVIGRAAVVELLADHALRQGSPIVALQGDLGDGKSSALNLLRRAVAGKAIVVSFSAWLPGSEVTLSTDLFSDIATECRKYVHVPRLRKTLLTYARAIGGSVPRLAGMKELLPTRSQRDDIQDLREALSRLPVRILALIDEIDRMQKEELAVLLKVLRGAFTIPNVSFVCAFSEKHVTDEMQESRDYLEKFFPVSVSLSGPSSDLVGKLFQARLKNELAQQRWFIKEEDEANFSKLLEGLWQDALAMLCTNLRKANILLNDIFAAARSIVGEVNPFDLVAIEAVRRFFPETYRLVRTNRPYLTPGSSSWAKYEYSWEEKRKEGIEKFAAEVKQASADGGKPEAAQALLSWLFPAYESLVNASRRFHSHVNRKNESTADAEKRICSADYFHIYFRGQVPEEMFSNAELSQMVSDLNEAASDAGAGRIFSGILESIPPKHPKREDFLWKANRAEGLTDLAVERLAYAAADRAANYAYDFLKVGEAAQALNLVFTAAQRLSATHDAQRVLETAMARASDDTFALRILEFTEHQDRNKVLTNFTHINAGTVRAAFITRMRRRYGADSVTQEVDLKCADWQAFRLWANNSPEDREIAYAFWRGFIGKSRRKLAQAADFAFPRGVSWSGGYPSAAVSDVFPADEFRRLLGDIPEGEPLNEVEMKAIGRMERLVAGTWEGEGELPGLNIS